MNKQSVTSIYPPIFLTLSLFAGLSIYLLFSNTDIGGNNKTFEGLISLFILFIAALIIFYRPIWGLGAIVFSLPFKSVWPDLANQIFSGVPLITSFIVILGSLTLGSTLIHIIDKRLDLPKISWEHIIAGLFVLWIGLSHFGSINEYVDGRVWFWTYIQLLSLMVLSTILITSVDYAKIFAYALIFGTLISVVGGFLSEGFEISQEASFSIRLAGLHGNPNEFAIMCIISLICLNYIVPSLQNKTARILGYALIPFMFFGLAFSISRTGLIAAILVTTIMIVLKFRVKFSNLLIKSTPITMFVFGFIVLVTILPSQYRDLWFGSIYHEVSNQSGTTGVRFEIWRISIDAFKKHPITGIGMGNFKEYAENEWSLEYRDQIKRASHNTYLGILSEAGLVGLSLFLFFNIPILLKLLSRSKTRGMTIGYENVSYMLFLILIVWATFGFFSNGEYGKLLWLVNGAALGMLNTIHTNATPETT